jgi:hypothetical protein
MMMADGVMMMIAVDDDEDDEYDDRVMMMMTIVMMMMMIDHLYCSVHTVHLPVEYCKSMRHLVSSLAHSVLPEHMMDGWMDGSIDEQG